jgi:hypothetical protein
MIFRSPLQPPRENPTAPWAHVPAYKFRGHQRRIERPEHCPGLKRVRVAPPGKFVTISTELAENALATFARQRSQHVVMQRY